jgi:hypothetical protein
VEQSTRTVTKIQEEFKQKIDSIEQKWSKLHEEAVTKLVKQFDSKEQEYKQTIASYEKTKTVSINEKHFGVEAGMMSDRDIYAHATMDVWGPIFIGLQGEVQYPNNDNKADNRIGAGLGLRF